MHALNSKAAILVVEDETLIRLWAADLLEENGFSVLEAEDADAALKVLESRPDVKLLFTDVQMPGSLNGMELAREVHARWPHILLVITSGRERPTRARFLMTVASLPSRTLRNSFWDRSTTCCTNNLAHSEARTTVLAAGLRGLRDRTPAGCALPRQH